MNGVLEHSLAMKLKNKSDLFSFVLLLFVVTLHVAVLCFTQLLGRQCLRNGIQLCLHFRLLFIVHIVTVLVVLLFSFVHIHHAIHFLKKGLLWTLCIFLVAWSVSGITQYRSFSHVQFDCSYKLNPEYGFTQSYVYGDTRTHLEFYIIEGHPDVVWIQNTFIPELKKRSTCQYNIRFYKKWDYSELSRWRLYHLGPIDLCDEEPWCVIDFNQYGILKGRKEMEIVLHPEHSVESLLFSPRKRMELL